MAKEPDVSAGARRAFTALERRAKAAERRAAEADGRAAAAEARERALSGRLERLEAKLDRMGEAVATVPAHLDAALRELRSRGVPAAVMPVQQALIDAGGTADVLHGYSEIGHFLRMTGKQAEHRARLKEIPVFKVGRIVCARRSTLSNWMSNQEAARNG